MTIDLLILGNAPVARMLERVKLAEASGYDTVWLADERFYREVYSCLTYFAQNTTRVKMGPCVTDPYARHPALTAMAIATLDEIFEPARRVGHGRRNFRLCRARCGAQEAGTRDPGGDRADPFAVAGRDCHLQRRGDSIQ